MLCSIQDLRDECLELRTRVFDLEQQNWALSVLFQQKIRPASDLLLQVVATKYKSRVRLTGATRIEEICYSCMQPHG